jgi:hypothetical protein
VRAQLAFDLVDELEVQLEQAAEEADDEQQVLRRWASEAAIVIFQMADGKIAERWAGWKPGYAPGR